MKRCMSYIILRNVMGEGGGHDAWAETVTLCHEHHFEQITYPVKSVLLFFPQNSVPKITPSNSVTERC